MQDISALSYPVAFAAGFVSFASPCVLALVPGYLTFISGVSFDELGARTKDVMVPTVAFVLGLLADVHGLRGQRRAWSGYSLTRNQDVLNLVAGCLLIAMGIAMVAFPRIGLMQTDRRLATARRPTTLVGAGLVGAAFAVGWTPCIGPILGSILTYAAPTGSPGIGATLLFTYSLGLGIPFLLSGLFITRTMAHLPLDARPLDARQRRRRGGVRVIGFLVATGRFEVITQQLSGVGFSGIYEDRLDRGEPAPVREGRAAQPRAAPPGRRGAGAQRPALRPGARRPVLRRARRAAARPRPRGGLGEPGGPDSR